MNPQSIKDRLKNIAKSNGTILQEQLTAYALERTIFRIGKSRYCENFSLKGGILLYALYDKNYPRITSDIDLRADSISSDENEMHRVFSEIFSINFDDGIEYDFSTLKTAPITKLDDYQGINLSIAALLGNIRIPVSIDIGFGDKIVPCKRKMKFPVLLDMEPPEVFAYSVESMIAEKFEAAASLGYANTRYKDFYDLYMLLNDKMPNAELLTQAISATFSFRRTRLDDIVIFEDDFALDATRISRWRAFCKKKKALATISFKDAIDKIKSVLKPIVDEMPAK